MPIPNPLFLFRLTHVNNVPYTLKNGIWTASSPNADPQFVPIGDKSIITSRTVMPVKVAPGGNLEDYIPFYFGARSPMLYVIMHGHNGVTKRHQSEIVYLVVPFSRIKDCGAKWIFTDGNARDFASQHYNQENDFQHLDWEVIGSQDWQNRDSDFDRKRRKQAEFLVLDHVPATCISHIIVYDENTANFVRGHVGQSGLNIIVQASKKHYY